MWDFVANGDKISHGNSVVTMATYYASSNSFSPQSPKWGEEENEEWRLFRPSNGGNNIAT